MVLSETVMQIGFIVCLTIALWWVLFLVFLRWREIVGYGRRLLPRFRHSASLANERAATAPSLPTYSAIKNEEEPDRRQDHPTSAQPTRHGRAILARSFRFAGRLSRIHFLIAQVIVGACFGIILQLGLWLLASSNSAVSSVGATVIGLGLIASIWVLAAACAKRTRDTGVTVWWALALLVPPVNLAASVFLLFVPTDEFAGRGL